MSPPRAMISTTPSAQDTLLPPGAAGSPGVPTSTPVSPMIEPVPEDGAELTPVQSRTPVAFTVKSRQFGSGLLSAIDTERPSGRRVTAAIPAPAAPPLML